MHKKIANKILTIFALLVMLFATSVLIVACDQSGPGGSPSEPFVRSFVADSSTLSMTVTSTQYRMVLREHTITLNRLSDAGLVDIVDDIPGQLGALADEQFFVVISRDEFVRATVFEAGPNALTLVRTVDVIGNFASANIVDGRLNIVTFAQSADQVAQPALNTEQIVDSQHGQVPVSKQSVDGFDVRGFVAISLQLGQSTAPVAKYLCGYYPVGQNLCQQVLLVQFRRYVAEEEFWNRSGYHLYSYAMNQQTGWACTSAQQAARVTQHNQHLYMLMGSSSSRALECRDLQLRIVFQRQLVTFGTYYFRPGQLVGTSTNSAWVIDLDDPALNEKPVADTAVMLGADMALDIWPISQPGTTHSTTLYDTRTWQALATAQITYPVPMIQNSRSTLVASLCAYDPATRQITLVTRNNDLDMLMVLTHDDSDLTLGQSAVLDADIDADLLTDVQKSALAIRQIGALANGFEIVRSGFVDRLDDSLALVSRTDNRRTVTLRFDTAGGSAIPEQKRELGDQITPAQIALLDTQRDGWQLVRWVIDAGDKFYNFKRDITLRAVWQEVVA